MPSHSYLVLATFTFLGIAMIVYSVSFRIRRLKVMEKPSIDLFFFITGKLALFLSWALFLAKAIMPSLGSSRLPFAFSWIAAVLTIAGALLVVAGIRELGSSITVGLPEKETHLSVTGIYRFTRNPIYLGLILVTVASCLYFPEPGNIGLAAYGILFHHRIILAEEQFLEKRFGEEWKNYCKRTRRYL
jgi:protein-S-isoprenylcysteine O-methyltransferase Ste14